VKTFRAALNGVVLFFLQCEFNFFLKKKTKKPPDEGFFVSGVQRESGIARLIQMCEKLVSISKKINRFVKKKSSKSE
jgi:hypothetical protein